MAQQVEKLSVPFGPKGPDSATVLAKQWRGLNRAATFVACLTSPGVFLWLLEQRHARWWLAILGTLAMIAAFRGLVDILARRVIPWPNLFGADTKLLQEDVVARRRAEYWRGKYRLAIVFGLFFVGILVYNLIRYDQKSLSAPLSTIKDGITYLGTQAPTLLPTLFFLMIINVLIFIGPFLFLAVRQIRAYEPGDADWGVKLEHVRGQAEAKEEIQRVINLWQAGDEFKAAGGKPERGLLFLGAPGTGKTMLAKAIATGFNSPFVTCPGSGFAGMFIGMDILAVQYLGWKAKKLARKWGGQCIVFIDEIDAVGLRRSALVGSAMPSAAGDTYGHVLHGPTGALTASGDVVLKNEAWREHLLAQRQGTRARGGVQAFLTTVGKRVNIVGGMGMMGGGSGALNQLLVLMDGIEEPPLMRRVVTNRTNAVLDALYIVPRRVGKVSLRLGRPKARANNIYFIGACNVSLDVLDPALTRPGRLGRHIRFRTPVKHDRADIFDHYLGKVSHDPSLDSATARDELARITKGYSPAMIEQVCSMALTYAHHDERPQFTRDDIVEAMTTIESGSAVNIDYTSAETRAIAVHEAGHAIASHIYGEGLESTRLSIRMRGGSFGHHQAIEKEERFSKFRSEQIAELIWIMGAISAEQVFYGENSWGVGGDMASATWIARRMSGNHAMGPVRIEFGDRFLTNSEEEEAREKVKKRLQAIGERLVATASIEDASGGTLNARGEKRNIVCEFLGYSYYLAYNTMVQNKDAVEKVADVLVERREIHGDEVVELLNKCNLKPAKIDYLEESTWPRL